MGDFIEDRLDRVHEAFHDGVRAITIVHYHVNQIGDIQTEAPVHQGLTPLGKSIVREMNRAGIIVDLAHATLAVAKDVVETSTKPVMVSHTNLLTPTATFPRLISSEHAKLVAAAGGIIGSWPSGMGQATFADFIDSIQRLVDAVGVEHVAIGTDMDANYKPVLRSYRDWSLIPGGRCWRGVCTRPRWQVSWAGTSCASSGESLTCCVPCALPVATTALVASCWLSLGLAREAATAQVTITRDDWGIAHVKGHTDADAVFGMIYAQAEDDFNRIETNYLVNLGRLCEAAGEDESAIWKDLRQRLFLDPQTLQADYARSPHCCRS